MYGGLMVAAGLAREEVGSGVEGGIPRFGARFAD